VEKFLDTLLVPSWDVRLAFAVAAYLEPEIVDEVLAVGDVQFQKKMFSRMRAWVARDLICYFVAIRWPSAVIIYNHVHECSKKG